MYFVTTKSFLKKTKGILHKEKKKKKEDTGKPRPNLWLRKVKSLFHSNRTKKLLTLGLGVHIKSKEASFASNTKQQLRKPECIKEN